MPKLSPSKVRQFRLLPVAIVLIFAASALASKEPGRFWSLVSIFPDSFEMGDVCEWSNASSFEVSWYTDVDNDSFGDPAAATVACRQPQGNVDNGLDCNDGDPLIHPGAFDFCANGIDENCDGEDANKSDFDSDGWSSCNGDCNDHNSSIHPGVIEVCNGIDDDCD
ncbi:MAG: putative metal-binding motif-containing protein, partial [Thermoanaerobaculia bacterium]